MRSLELDNYVVLWKIFYFNKQFLPHGIFRKFKKWCLNLVVIFRLKADAKGQRTSIVCRIPDSCIHCSKMSICQKYIWEICDHNWISKNISTQAENRKRLFCKKRQYNHRTIILWYNGYTIATDNMKMYSQIFQYPQMYPFPHFRPDMPFTFKMYTYPCLTIFLRLPPLRRLNVLPF